MGHEMKISLLIPIGSMSQRRPKRDFENGYYYLNHGCTYTTLSK